LCWNDGWSTYYPRRQYTYGSSGNKFPTNSKGIVSAIVVPYQPLNLAGVAQSNSSIAVSWSAPAYNGGTTITSYTLVVLLNDVKISTFTGITTTNKTVSGLTSGQTYTFIVSAVNQIGTGATASVSATTI
jgi:titin